MALTGKSFIDYLPLCKETECCKIVELPCARVFTRIQDCMRLKEIFGLSRSEYLPLIFRDGGAVRKFGNTAFTITSAIGELSLLLACLAVWRPRKKSRR